MNNLSTWFYNIIITYVELPEAIALKSTNRAASESSASLSLHRHRQHAAEIVSKTVRRWHAQYTLVVRFLDKCAGDIDYRLKYFNIHRHPRPHICLYTIDVLKYNAFQNYWAHIWEKRKPNLTKIVTEAAGNINTLENILTNWVCI